MIYERVRRLGRGGMAVVDLARGPDGVEVALERITLPEETTPVRQAPRCVWVTGDA